MRKIVAWAFGLVLAVFLLIQLVPYGRDHTNPPVVQEPAWEDPVVRDLAEQACFDCHSNETDWSPWYADIAPASWLVQRDVVEGREHLNFSEWSAGRPEEADETAEVVLEGEMPPFQYLIMHPEARLSEAQKQQLASGLARLGR
jgi:cytochrome c551/c552